ncbi:unnamed protein product [Symbiodinium natans]|uniref:Uncharacterized protein n=1 Tax=Symbiodinium natans TaxID=878477 RepID=A0A812QRP9_9DINO|nr:unnamed protein product [Symbiodinium natans]
MPGRERTMLETAPCSAFNWAYVLGLICTMAIILNFTLLAASIAMLLQYFNSTKHKPEYRQYAFYLHAVATGIIFLTFLAWSFLALPALDHIGASSGYASSGLGVSYGYCLMVVGILFQSVSAALFSFMPLGDEMTEDERMFHKFAKEQAHNAHMAAAQPGQPGPPGPPGQPVGYYGAAPPVPNAAQPGYGYGYGYGPQQGQTPAW